MCIYNKNINHIYIYIYIYIYFLNKIQLKENISNQIILNKRMVQIYVALPVAPKKPRKLTYLVGDSGTCSSSPRSSGQILRMLF
jgi:hypothetical protein